MWNEIEAQIGQITGIPFQGQQRRSVGGGCINQGYQLSDGERSYFVKLNSASFGEMFAAELLGLQQMAETHTIRVPKPLGWGTAGSSSYIILGWLEMGRGGDWAEMGRQLARMHRFHAGKVSLFGWQRNNTIGSTPQINTWTDSWVEFWAVHRLGYQFQLTRRRGGDFPKQDALLAAIPDLLAGHDPVPSLVHGDLWGGNGGFTRDGEPVIFDPAAYFGDREVDLAMTELFGGFPTAFYQGYNQEFPLEPGYEQRKTLYNLYHILNHFNLFGGGYDSQANSMIERLLR